MLPLHKRASLALARIADRIWPPTIKPKDALSAIALGPFLSIVLALTTGPRPKLSDAADFVMDVTDPASILPLALFAILLWLVPHGWIILPLVISLWGLAAYLRIARRDPALAESAWSGFLWVPKLAELISRLLSHKEVQHILLYAAVSSFATIAGFMTGLLLVQRTAFDLISSLIPPLWQALLGIPLLFPVALTIGALASLAARLVNMRLPVGLAITAMGSTLIGLAVYLPMEVLFLIAYAF